MAFYFESSSWLFAQWTAGPAHFCWIMDAHCGGVPIGPFPARRFLSGHQRAVFALAAQVPGACSPSVRLLCVFAPMCVHVWLECRVVLCVFVAADPLTVNGRESCGCAALMSLLLSVIVAVDPLTDVNGRELQTLEASPPSDIMSVAFSLDERCVIAGLSDGSVVLYAVHLPDY